MAENISLAPCEPQAETGQAACLKVSDLCTHLLLRIFRRHYMQQTSKGRPPMVRGGGQRSSVLRSEKIAVQLWYILLRIFIGFAGVPLAPHPRQLAVRKPSAVLVGAVPSWRGAGRA